MLAGGGCLRGRNGKSGGFDEYSTFAGRRARFSAGWFFRDAGGGEVLDLVGV